MLDTFRRPSVPHRLVQDYEWFHTWIGILGNIAFLAGSVLFLFESLKTVGVWFFIVGAFGMLVGSVGRVLVDRARRHD